MNDDNAEKTRLHAHRWGLWLSVSAVLTIIMLYFFYFRPSAAIGPEQPIPFSHRVHAGVKAIDCRFCHSGVDRSKNAGIPETAKCFYCHDYVIPTHPEIMREKQYFQTNAPVPWKRVYYLPDYVKFFHFPHTRWARLDCINCHGPVEKMDRLKPVNFRMGFCMQCHRQMNAQLDCWLACHH